MVRFCSAVLVMRALCVCLCVYVCVWCYFCLYRSGTSFDWYNVCVLAGIFVQLFLLLVTCTYTFLITSCACCVYGVGIQDAFKDGNVIQLLTRNKGFPIQIKGGAVNGDGTFGHDQSELLWVERGWEEWLKGLGGGATGGHYCT